jgi:hypothetical protein
MNTNKISIEDVVVIAGVVTVDYLLNGEEKTDTVTLHQLTQFALNTGLNEYVYDHNCGDEHIQLEGSHDIDTFMSENLNEVVKAFLEVKRIEDAFKSISDKLSVLIVSF